MDWRTHATGPRCGVSLVGVAKFAKMMGQEVPMATMNISLPDPMKEWVEAQARTGRSSNSATTCAI